MPRDDAMLVAQEALHRIDKHEAVCTERHQQIAKYMDEAKTARTAQHYENQQAIAAVKKSIAGLYDWRFKIASFLIAVMGSAIVGLSLYIYQSGVKS